MRVIIILAAIAFTHGAKLEKTYLPPSNARTAGGSGNFLQTPFPGSSGSSRLANSPARNTHQNGNTQAEFGQSGNGFSQSGNEFSQFGNDFSQSGNNYAQSGNGFSQSGAFDNVNFAAEARPERPRAAFERNAAILRQDNSNDGETYSYAFETENGIYAEENAVATNGVEAQGGFSYTGDDGKVYSVRYTADQNGFVPVGDHIPTPPPVPEEILKALEQNARDEAAGIFDDGSYNEGKYSAGDSNNYNGQVNYQQNNRFEDDTVITNSALTRSGPATFNAPRDGPAYNAPRNGPAYNAPNAAVAPIYGAPNAGNAPSFNSATAAIAPTYGTPNAQDARTYVAPNSSNAPSYTARAGNAPSFNAGSSRTSDVEKAYLPPFADQRGQGRNAFGRRQQNFNAKTGYQY